MGAASGQSMWIHVLHPPTAEIFAASIAAVLGAFYFLPLSHKQYRITVTYIVSIVLGIVRK